MFIFMYFNQIVYFLLQKYEAGKKIIIYKKFYIIIKIPSIIFYKILVEMLCAKYNNVLIKKVKIL